MAGTARTGSLSTSRWAALWAIPSRGTRQRAGLLALQSNILHCPQCALL